MRMTPLDIRQKRFAAEFRGYAPREVESFLDQTAAEFEDVVKENIALKEEQRRILARLEQHQEREKALQETMVTAQRVSEDLKAQGKKEAEIVVAQAELQADKIIANANQKLVDLVGEISELKRQKVQFESQLDSVIDAHKKLLDTFRTDGAGELAFLVKKKGSDSA